MNISIGLIRVTIKYSYPRGNSTYYQRGVPQDLRAHYGSKTVKIKVDDGSNKANLRLIARRIEEANRETEAEWASLRAAPDASPPQPIKNRAAALLASWGLHPAGGADNDESAESAFFDSLDLKREKFAKGDEETYREANGTDYLTPHEIEAAKLLAGTAKPCLNDALDLYLDRHKKRNNDKFCRQTRSAFARVTAITGNKPIAETSRDDAYDFVKKLGAAGLASGSIRRRLNTARAVVSAYFTGKEIHRANPFGNITIPDEGDDEEDAIPYTGDELVQVIKCAKAADDDVRWVVAMIADTGARLGEIVGLALADIKLDASTPHLVLKVHPWRDLKNKQSARVVPLVGCALWAAKRVKETATTGQTFAFPRYNKRKLTASNSASGVLNKWVKSKAVGLDHTIHELRHTMADRLRDVQCPADIRLRIGGWNVTGEGENYGDGYTLKVREEWLLKVVKQSTLDALPAAISS